MTDGGGTEQTISIIEGNTQKWRHTMLPDTVVSCLAGQKKINAEEANNIMSEEKMEHRVENLISLVKRRPNSLAHALLLALIITGQKKCIPSNKRAHYESLAATAQVSWHGCTLSYMRRTVECFMYSVVLSVTMFQGVIGSQLINILGYDPIRSHTVHITFLQRTKLFAAMKQSYQLFTAFASEIPRHQWYLQQDELRTFNKRCIAQLQFSLRSSEVVPIPSLEAILEKIKEQSSRISITIQKPVDSVNLYENIIMIDLRLKKQEPKTSLEQLFNTDLIQSLFSEEHYYNYLERNWNIQIQFFDSSDDIDNISLSTTPSLTSLRSRGPNDGRESDVDTDISMEQQEARAIQQRRNSRSHQQPGEQQAMMRVIVGMISSLSFTEREFYDKLKTFQRKTELENLVDREGRNMLHLCVIHKRVSFLQVIFDLGLMKALNQIGPRSGYRTTPYDLCRDHTSRQMKDELMFLIQWESKLPAIYTAARAGQCDKVKTLLSHDPTLPNFKEDLQNSTVLYMAVLSGSLRLVKLLCEKYKMEPHCVTRRGDTMLTCAARLGHLDILKYLIIEVQLDVNKTDGAGLTILELSIKHSDMPMFQYLMDDVGMLLNKSKALNIMCHSSRVEFVRSCLGEGRIRVTTRIGDQGLTALHVAVLANRIDMVDFLMTQGVDYRARDRHLENVLHKLAYTGSKEMAERLISIFTQRDSIADMCRVRNLSVCKDRARLLTAEKNNETVWYYIDVARENLDALSVTLKNRNVETMDLEHIGRVLATGTGHPTQAERQRIIERYNTLENRHEDCTPFLLCLINGFKDVALLLLPHTKDVNQGDMNKLTAVHVAAMRGLKDVVVRLCQRSVAVDVVTASGVTPSRLAEKYGHGHITRYLRSATYTHTATEFHNSVLKPFSINLKPQSLEAIRDRHVDIRTYTIEQARLLQAELRNLFYKIETTALSVPSDDLKTVTSATSDDASMYSSVAVSDESSAGLSSSATEHRHTGPTGDMVHEPLDTTSVNAYIELEPSVHGSNDTTTRHGEVSGQRV